MRKNIRKNICKNMRKNMRKNSPYRVKIYHNVPTNLLIQKV